LALMREIFPRGVCDYTKPGVGQQHSIPWMSYADGPGGKPLGPAPQSASFGPAVTVNFPPVAAPRTCPAERKLKLRIRTRRGTRVRSIAIYVDGRNTGLMTPKTLSLSEGAHKITLIKDKVAKTISVEIAAGKMASTSRTFE
jgi:hypothetical protein